MGEPVRRRQGKVSDEELLAAAAMAPNMRQLLLTLGVAAYGGNYESIRARLRRLGIEPPGVRVARRQWPEVPKTRLEQAVLCSDGFAGVARLVGLGSDIAAGKRVRALTELHGIDTSHFTGRGWKRGDALGGRPPPSWDQVLVAGVQRDTNNLKRRLLREHVLPPRCACCRRERWQGRAIPLELDHVNGDRSDNRLENLRLLCPNCHALTPTYRGRNIGRRAAGGPRRSAEEVAAAQDRAAATRRRLRALYPNRAT